MRMKNMVIAAMAAMSVLSAPVLAAATKPVAVERVQTKDKKDQNLVAGLGLLAALAGAAAVVTTVIVVANDDDSVSPT